MLVLLFIQMKAYMCVLPITPGQSVSDSELVELYRAKIKQLQDMGFGKTEKELALLLHSSRGDTQTACLSLMGCT